MGGKLIKKPINYEEALKLLKYVANGKVVFNDILVEVNFIKVPHEFYVTLSKHFKRGDEVILTLLRIKSGRTDSKWGTKIHYIITKELKEGNTLKTHEVREYIWKHSEFSKKVEELAKNIVKQYIIKWVGE